MPDASHPQTNRPLHWSEAFAALPQEAPPAQGWERLAARMEARTSVARKVRTYGRAPAWIGLAIAATLVLAVTLWQRRTPAQPSHARLASQPAATQRSMAPLYKGKEPMQPVVATTEVAKPAPPTVGATEVAPTKPEGRRKPEVRIAASATPTKTPPTRAPSVAEPSHARLASRPETTERSKAALYRLYAESAQLEALLGLARDDRVSSAGAALLADALDAQVAAIDASLAQPDLDDGARLRLWQARVAALRQAAGFESTQRLLASQGRNEVMLVSVD